MAHILLPERPYMTFLSEKKKETKNMYKCVDLLLWTHRQ